jgi:antitoxin CptB
MNDDFNDLKRRDRLRFRSWHRGTREMDLLLGHFADAHIHALSVEYVTQYEAVLEIGDPDLYNWIAGREPVPAEHNSAVMQMLCKHSFVEKA